MKPEKAYRTGSGSVANIRTHHAERAGVAELELDGTSPPSGVDTVDMNLSRPDEVPRPAALGLTVEK